MNFVRDKDGNILVGFIKGDGTFYYLDGMSRKFLSKGEYTELPADLALAELLLSEIGESDSDYTLEGQLRVLLSELIQSRQPKPKAKLTIPDEAWIPVDGKSMIPASKKIAVKLANGDVDMGLAADLILDGKHEITHYAIIEIGE